MRDPDSLDKLYEELKVIHRERLPDMRFCQMVYNFFKWYIKTKKADYFFLEDDKFIDAFEEFVNDISCED